MDILVEEELIQSLEELNARLTGYLVLNPIYSTKELVGIADDLDLVVSCLRDED